mmetsp:Transcript_109135/g.319432  ORF Transcript_109135/g.319432 Transcript_109135/m.319432 type:complete len:80 (-) Transcript_109135:1308-1547(-)
MRHFLIASSILFSALKHAIRPRWNAAPAVIAKKMQKATFQRKVIIMFGTGPSAEEVICESTGFCAHLVQGAPMYVGCST